MRDIIYRDFVFLLKFHFFRRRLRKYFSHFACSQDNRKKGTDKIYAIDVWIVYIIIKIVMTSRTCNQNRAPSRESGENRRRIETLTAKD